MAHPTPSAPSLQGSAPGSAVDYPLHGLELHTNYTATLRGLRGPNLTSPASITFTTGEACEVPGTEGRGGAREPGWGSSISIFFSFLSLPGLEAPQDLEAKEVTPRTVLLTWTAPQVPPTGYLITFNTPGGQTQVPHPCPCQVPVQEALPLPLQVGLPLLLPAPLSPDLPLVCPTGDPAPRRGHLSPAPGPLSLHPLQCLAPGHVGRELHPARVHFLHHWYV